MGYTYLLYLLIFLPGTLLLYAVVPQRAGAWCCCWPAMCFSSSSAGS